MHSVIFPFVCIQYSQIMFGRFEKRQYVADLRWFKWLCFRATHPYLWLRADLTDVISSELITLYRWLCQHCDLILFAEECTWQVMRNRFGPQSADFAAKIVNRVIRQMETSLSKLQTLLLISQQIPVYVLTCFFLLRVLCSSWVSSDYLIIWYYLRKRRSKKKLPNELYEKMLVIAQKNKVGIADCQGLPPNRMTCWQRDDAGCYLLHRCVMSNRDLWSFGERPTKSKRSSFYIV